MRKYSYSAVVIGSGCAGYNCADWLYDLGCREIALVTEGKNVGTSRNAGSDKQTYYKLSLAGDEGDSIRGMAGTLFSGGCMDGDVALAEAANSVRSFMKLAGLGVHFPTNNFGEYVGYKTDHDPYQRATSVGPYTSKEMTEVLERSVTSKGIPVLDQCRVIRILTDNGAVTGLLALDLSIKDKVEYVLIECPNVVLATGGPATVYFDSVYPLGHNGASSLALNAGAEFVNLSEWQYGLASIDFRWNVSGTYQQVLPRYISVDEKGVEREFLLEHMTSAEMLKNIFLKGYEWPFDVRKIHGSSYIDLLVYDENVRKGRAVYLDFMHEPTGLEGGFEGLDPVVYEYLKNSDALVALPIERLRKMNPGAIALYKNNGIDIAKEPLKIAVCAQHNNGGVRVDANWQTNVKGLYTIGEAAGTLGVFRPGGSALNSCQVGGLRAARHIRHCSDNTVSSQFEEIAKAAMKECDSLIASTKGNTSTISDNLQTYRKEMSKNFAFLRSENEMESGLARIQVRRKNFAADNKWKCVSQIPELFINLDCIQMCEAVATGMLAVAKECGSRGSAFVLTQGDVLDRKPVEEKAESRTVLHTVKKSGEELIVVRKAVKPIPERNLWFESVWKEYRTMTEEQ